MKKILFSIIAASALLLTGCGTSSYYALSGFQDGIYYRASKEEQAQKELEAEEVLNLINRTIQQAKAFSDTIQYAEVTPQALPAGTEYMQQPSYWDYNYPWNFYGNGNWSGYYGWAYAPGYYGWGYAPAYYTWDPWFYGPNTPWGLSFGWGFGWDPWYYGPYWSFYGGYYGGPWDPYWYSPYWGYYLPCWYPPHYAHGGSSTGYYYGRRDAAHGGVLASTGRHATGVRGANESGAVRGRNPDNSSLRPKLNVVRGRELPANSAATGRIVKDELLRDRQSSFAGSAIRRDNLGESYVFRGQPGDNSTLRNNQGLRRDAPAKGNFRKTEQNGNRPLPDFSRSGNTVRREGSSWDSGFGSSGYNDRNSSAFRNSGSSGVRSSGSTGGSVRSSGGSTGGGRVGPRR